MGNCRLRPPAELGSATGGFAQELQHERLRLLRARLKPRATRGAKPAGACPEHRRRAGSQPHHHRCFPGGGSRRRATWVRLVAREFIRRVRCCRSSPSTLCAKPLPVTRQRASRHMSSSISRVALPSRSDRVAATEVVDWLAVRFVGSDRYGMSSRTLSMGL